MKALALTGMIIFDHDDKKKHGLRRWSPGSPCGVEIF